MRARLHHFIDALRAGGIAPSVSETLDAAAAVAEAGVERSVLRESLAATLVKDHADRPVFDEIFDRCFAPPVPRGKPRRRAPAEAGEGGRGGEGSGRGAQSTHDAEGAAAGERSERGQRSSRGAQALQRRRALGKRSFREMDPREVEEARDLVEDLGRRFPARVALRLERARHGRLDMRRTIRRALGRGGVPIELLLRRPRPGKPSLVALLDLSHSTATAARFLLSLLAPAHLFFRRITLLAYVDALAEISFEGGHVVPHAPLDLHARSDFGKVLRQLDEERGACLDRNTVLLILGDARNNRRPPRADLLAAMHAQVRAVVWLNPETPERWNTADSVMASYARHVDLLLPAWNLQTLLAALTRVAARLF